MTATDDQLARLRDAGNRDLFPRDREALAAVISELTALRRKVTDQANSLRHAAEEVEGLRELRDVVELYISDEKYLGKLNSALAKCQK